MSTLNCSFFDKNFFIKHFDEILPQNAAKIKNCRNFEVKCQAMRVDWILSNDEGKLLLQNMIACENPELFNNKAVKILINYLFSEFKFKILQRRLPLYVGQLASFLLAVSLDDRVTSEGYILSAN